SMLVDAVTGTRGTPATVGVVVVEPVMWAQSISASMPITTEPACAWAPSVPPNRPPEIEVDNGSKRSVMRLRGSCLPHAPPPFTPTYHPVQLKGAGAANGAATGATGGGPRSAASAILNANPESITAKRMAASLFMIPSPLGLANATNE